MRICRRTFGWPCRTSTLRSFLNPVPRGLRNLTLSTVLADELEPTALKVLWVTCVAKCACLPRSGGTSRTVPSACAIGTNGGFDCPGPQFNGGNVDMTASGGQAVT